MAQIKLAEYTFDNTIDANCLPNIKPNTITMTSSDSVEGNITTRTVYIDDTTMPTQINFENKTSLLTVTYLNADNKISWDSMFNNCSNLTSVNLTYSKGENITNFFRAFCNCSKLEEIIGLSNFHVKIDNMDNLFGSCAKLKEIDLSGAIIENVYTGYYAFSHCREVTKIKFPSNTIKMNREMWQMFAHCRVLEELDLSMFDTSNVTNMRQTFDGCYKLKSLNLSNFNTEKVERMDGMFYDCWSLTSLDISNFNTEKVQYMGNMFYNTRIEKMILPENFVATSLKYGSSIFNNCNKLKELDLCNFKPSSCMEVSGMFKNCPLLETLDISNFDMSSATSYSNMFQNTNNLKTVGMLFSDATTINKVVTVFRSNNSTPLDIYYYDADKTQLTPTDGINFIKYEYPRKLSLPPHIELHSVNNIRDELDIKTGILTRRINKNEDGTLSILETLITEKIIINYNEPCEYGRILPNGAMDYYNVATSEYLQNISSILLDGTFTENWIISRNDNVGKIIAGRSSGNGLPHYKILRDNYGFPYTITNENSVCTVGITSNPDTSTYTFNDVRIYFDEYFGNYHMTVIFPNSYEFTTSQQVNDWLNANPITIITTRENPTTEKIIINYNEPCEYGRILPNGAMDYYNVATSEYLQNISSILLDGANEWNEIVENENTVRVLYASPTDIKMKASGGLYCDNDMFPNIQDDSDVEHCRVHDTDNNKLYIYIDKNKLMSPDLVGFQIWLQENQFTVYYETSETIISIKDYSELDPELARWEMIDCKAEGKIEYNGVIYPKISYQASSANRFEIDNLEPNTQYTVYAENMIENPTINLGGVSYNFVNGNIYTSGDNNIIIFNDSPNVSNMMLIKGDTRDEVVPYFEGMASVENPKVQCGGSTVSYTDLKLRSLPNGVKDTINVVTGEYVQRVGEIVLDGTQNMDADGRGIYIQVDDMKKVDDYRTIITCDKLPVFYHQWDLPNVENGISGYREEENKYPGQNWLYIKVNNSIDVDEVKEWLTQNPITVQYELAEPITTQLEPQTLLAYENGKILLSSESGLLPTLRYSLPSPNTFRLPIIKTRTQYTLKYPSASGTITIGNLTYNINSDSMVFTTPLTINGDKSAIVFSDDNPQNVMLIEGNYSKREVPLFSGVKSVTNPTITILNNATGESVLYKCSQNIDLRSLPNGVSDTLDIVNKKLTQVTGIRPFQDGDYELDNVWTDGNYTVYGLSSPIVSNVEIETPIGYTNSTIYLTSDYLIPVLNYRALSSNNFPLDLLLPNTTYTLYADTLVSGNYTLGGTHTGVFTGTEVISLGDITNNLLTFNGDLGLSNVMLIKGNTINSTFPFFRGLKSTMNYKLKVEGMNDELNELMLDDGIGLRACGNLVDSVDLMTCTLTRNLSELILNGSENWVDITSNENVDENYCLFAITVAGVKSSLNVNLACDRLNYYYLKDNLHDKESIYTEANQIRICIKKTTIGGDNVNALKSWLQQNNTTLIYALQNSVIIPLENQWTTMPPTSYMNQTTITSEVVDSLKPIITAVIAITSLEQIVSNLEEQNAMLEEENVATMMALAEVYEMMFADVAVMSLNMDDELSMEDEIEPVPISSMGMVYIKLIRKGLKTIDQVPSFLQKEVMYGLQKGK